MRKALVALLLGVIPGCAGVRLNLPTPQVSTQSNLYRLFNSPFSASRQIPAASRLELVNKVDKRILAAAISLCQRSFSDPEKCNPNLSRRKLWVATKSEEINAYVDKDLQVYMMGGIVGTSGSDDEVGFVLAHEYAHGLMGHVRKRMRNMALGELVGMGIGLGLSAAGGFDPASTGQVAGGAATLGGEIGAIKFSKKMELESDHLAAFILDEAGYDLDRAMEFFQRAHHLQRQYNQSGNQQVVGFLDTHPSDEERLLQLEATKEMILQGHNRPLWKK